MASEGVGFLHIFFHGAVGRIQIYAPIPKLISNHYTSYVPWSIFKCDTSIQGLSLYWVKKTSPKAIYWSLKTNWLFFWKFNYNFRYKKWVMKFQKSKFNDMVVLEFGFETSSLKYISSAMKHLATLFCRRGLKVLFL